MTEKAHLFYNDKDCCRELWEKIKENGTENLYICHDVTNPKIFEKLPKSFTTVPILVVKGIDTPLVGKEVFNWVDTQKYINLTSNNINQISNPDFYVDPTIGKPTFGNFSAIHDCDDKKMGHHNAYLEDIDNWKINASTNKRYIDKKISKKVQEERLKSLEQSRNTDLANILSTNKEF